MLFNLITFSCYNSLSVHFWAIQVKWWHLATLIHSTINLVREIAHKLIINFSPCLSSRSVSLIKSQIPKNPFKSINAKSSPKNQLVSMFVTLISTWNTSIQSHPALLQTQSRELYPVSNYPAHFLTKSLTASEFATSIVYNGIMIAPFSDS
jgi:hypothetical protein